jgi:16S rRNA (guanine966-N2)-methyltransferase
MRVISGSARGFRLKGPPSTATRPMADKIKGALFSMLASIGVEFDRVLDLYAGTGNIGIEALSRGASFAEFVDQSAAATAVIRANLEHTRFADRARVHTAPVASFLTRRETPFDFVILDPPYADPAIVETLEKVSASPLVQSGAIVAIGHSPRVALPDRIGRMERLRERCHGDSCFSIYEIDPEPGTDDVPVSAGDTGESPP